MKILIEKFSCWNIFLHNNLMSNQETKVSTFKLIHDTNFESFQNKVNELLKQGWLLHGYVKIIPNPIVNVSCRSYINYYQAMTNSASP